MQEAGQGVSSEKSFSVTNPNKSKYLQELEKNEWPLLGQNILMPKPEKRTYSDLNL